MLSCIYLKIGRVKQFINVASRALDLKIKTVKRNLWVKDLTSSAIKWDFYGYKK